jgi:hypothetical protein
MRSIILSFVLGAAALVACSQQSGSNEVFDGDGKTFGDDGEPSMALTTAQTARTWKGANGRGGDGNWNTAAHWSPATVPNSSTADAVINSSATITITADVVVRKLTVSSGGTITFSGNKRVLVRNNVTFAGLGTKIKLSGTGTGHAGILLGDGAHGFSFTGHDASRFFTSDYGKGVISWGSTNSSPDLYIDPNATLNTLGANKGTMSLKTNATVQRVNLNLQTAPLGVIKLGENVTFTITNEAASSLRASTVAGSINASATGAKVVIKGGANAANLINGNNQVFLKNSIVNSLELDLGSKVYIPNTNFTVHNLKVVSGSYNNNIEAKKMTIGTIVDSTSQTNGPLKVKADGTLLLNDQSFTGTGVNYYSAFNRTIDNANDFSYDDGFAKLAQLGIPFARLDISGYWPKNTKLFFTDRAEYFRRLDGVVASAKQHGVGLIPSFFWTIFTFSDLAGEHLDQLGVSNSLTRQMMREFTTEIVNRYKTSTAIWAWEFGNEWTLAVDLPNGPDHLPPTWTSLGNPATRDPVRDLLTTDLMLAAMRDFGSIVSTLDPGRPISTGHATPRPSQWRMDQWKRGFLPIYQVWGGSYADTNAQVKEIMLRHCPPPFNMMSVHIYENDQQRLPLFSSIASSSGKALFVGEFGTSPAEESKYMSMRSAVRSNSRLSAVWVYDRPEDAFNITTTNSRSWMLNAP